MRAPSRRMVLLLTFLAVLAVVMPFLVWHQTWFGRRLSEGEIERYLRDPQRPRKIQHALSQISDRIARNDPAVAGLYPSVVETARHPEHAIRATAAWVMGQDNTSEAFHQALLRLLEDPDLLVRRNAALSLVRFRDGSGRAELVAMLQSHAATAPANSA